MLDYIKLDYIKLRLRQEEEAIGSEVVVVVVVESDVLIRD